MGVGEDRWVGNWDGGRGVSSSPSVDALEGVLGPSPKLCRFNTENWEPVAIVFLNYYPI